MEAILDFLSNYYIYFLIAAGVLTFALIGFIVDARKKQKTVDGYGVNDMPTAQNDISQSVVGADVVIPQTPIETAPASEFPVNESVNAGEVEIMQDFGAPIPEVTPIVDTPLEAIPSEPVSSFPEAAPVESAFEVPTNDTFQIDNSLMGNPTENIQTIGNPVEATPTIEFPQAPAETPEPILNVEQAPVENNNIENPLG